MPEIDAAVDDGDAAARARDAQLVQAVDAHLSGPDLSGRPHDAVEADVEHVRPGRESGDGGCGRVAGQDRRRREPAADLESSGREVLQRGRAARGGGSQRHEDGSVTRARQHALELGRNVAGPRGGKPEEERGSHRKAGENRLGHGITSTPARGVQLVCL